jgi:hypothetical protein
VSFCTIGNFIVLGAYKERCQYKVDDTFFLLDEWAWRALPIHWLAISDNENGN